MLRRSWRSLGEKLRRVQLEDKPIKINPRTLTFFRILLPLLLILLAIFSFSAPKSRVSPQSLDVSHLYGKEVSDKSRKSIATYDNFSLNISQFPLIGSKKISMGSCANLASIYQIKVENISLCDQTLADDLRKHFNLGFQTIKFGSNHEFNLTVRVEQRDHVIHDDEDLLDMMVFVASQEDNLKNKIFFDVGMNLGLFSVAARLVGFEQIYSFEPQPLCHQLTRLSLLANGFNITLRHKLILTALGDPEEHEEFYPPLNQCGQGFHVPDSDALLVPGVKYKRPTVPITPLRTYLRGFGSIFFMKMDTEGFETRILQGIIPFFQAKKIKYFVVEITPDSWKTSHGEGIALFKDIHAAASVTYVRENEGRRKCHEGTSPVQKTFAGHKVLKVDNIEASIGQLVSDSSKRSHCDYFFLF